MSGRARLAGLALLTSILPGCAHWESIETHPGYEWNGDPYQARAVEKSGTAWLLSDFSIDGDTLRATGYEQPLFHDELRRSARGIDLALDDVEVIEERRHETGRELLLGGGIVGTLLLTVAILRPFSPD